MTFDSRKILQNASEFQFIVRVIEAQSQFWNQIMTVDQVGHNAILTEKVTAIFKMAVTFYAASVTTVFTSKTGGFSSVFFTLHNSAERISAA